MGEKKPFRRGASFFSRLDYRSIKMRDGENTRSAPSRNQSREIVTSSSSTSQAPRRLSW
jgi:hypothetical protein